MVTGSSASLPILQAATVWTDRPSRTSTAGTERTLMCASRIVDSGADQRVVANLTAIRRPVVAPVVEKAQVRDEILKARVATKRPHLRQPQDAPRRADGAAARVVIETSRQRRVRAIDVA